MKPNVVFNTTVCIVGIAILLIRLVNMIIKKNRRKDKNRLLTFLIFTVMHFTTYLALITLSL